LTAIVEAPPIVAGVYDIPEEDYFGATAALSCSGAKLLTPPSCPAKFFWRQDHPQRKSVFDFGSAAHKMVLGSGPEIAVIPADDWRTNDAKKARKAAYDAGQTPVLAKEHAEVSAMAEALKAHPVASALLDPFFGQSEQSLFWQDPRTQIWCRARLDWMPDPQAGEQLIIADYKTCASADPDSVAKAVGNFRYHMQHAWYADGASIVLGQPVHFVFIFQEKAPPYLVNIVRLDEEAVRIGRQLCSEAIDVYRACIREGDWPGYDDEEISVISLPAFSKPKTEWHR
jgi:hypothetical protein